MRRPTKPQALLCGLAIASVPLGMARATGWPAYPSGLPMMDFKSVVWAPLRGLAAGYNAYDVHSGYIQAFHVGGAATAHTPATLTLLAPLGFLPLRAAWLTLVALSVVCVWASLWVLARPKSSRDHVVVGALGLLVLFGGFGEFLLNLGDVTAFALLGTALVMRYPGRATGVIGVVLMSFVPQTGIPLCVLMARGRLRTLGLGWLCALALSIPPLAIALAAEGPRRLAASLLATVGSVVNNPNRIDAIGVILGHEQIVTAACIALFALACWRLPLRMSRDDTGRLTLAVVVVTLVFYHQPYDLVVVGAVGAAAACIDWSSFRGLVLVLAVGSALTLAPVAQHIGDALAIAPVPLWRLMVKLTAIASLAAVIFAERQRLAAMLAVRLASKRWRDAAAAPRRV